MRRYLWITAYMLWAVQPAMAESFVSGIDDLPVPNGFEEQQKYSLSYDTVGGRIVEVLYLDQGESTMDFVKKYYRETLPQLGWEKMSYGLYNREGEDLSLVIKKDKDDTVSVRFMLQPSIKSGVIHGE